MKKITIFILVILITVLSIPCTAYAKTVRVRGYYRKDGTYVRPHTRSYSSGSSSSSSGSSLSSYTSGSSTSVSSQINSNTSKKSNIVNIYKGKNYVSSESDNSLVYVRGYYDKNGRYVRPHYRTHPDNFIKNNFSYLGVSTLTPSAKYPNFTYSSNSKESTVEKYLLYNTINLNTTISVSDYAKLRNYAASLSGDIDSITYSTGVSFYKSLGMDEYSSDVYAKFDIEGLNTFDTYLFLLLQEIYGSDFKYKISNMKTQINDYSNKLYLYKHKDIDKTSLKISAVEFYKDVLNANEIEEQIEMDILQNLGCVTNNSYENQYLEDINLVFNEFISLNDKNIILDEQDFDLTEYTKNVRVLCARMLAIKAPSDKYFDHSQLLSRVLNELINICDLIDNYILTNNSSLLNTIDTSAKRLEKYLSQYDAELNRLNNIEKILYPN